MRDKQVAKPVWWSPALAILSLTCHRIEGWNTKERRPNNHAIVVGIALLRNHRALLTHDKNTKTKHDIMSLQSTVEGTCPAPHAIPLRQSVAQLLRTCASACLYTQAPNLSNTKLSIAGSRHPGDIGTTAGCIISRLKSHHIRTILDSNILAKESKEGSWKKTRKNH